MIATKEIINKNVACSQLTAQHSHENETTSQVEKGNSATINTTGIQGTDMIIKYNNINVNCQVTQTKNRIKNVPQKNRQHKKRHNKLLDEDDSDED